MNRSFRLTGNNSNVKKTGKNQAHSESSNSRTLRTIWKYRSNPMNQVKDIFLLTSQQQPDLKQTQLQITKQIKTTRNNYRDTLQNDNASVASGRNTSRTRRNLSSARSIRSNASRPDSLLSSRHGSDLKNHFLPTLAELENKINQLIKAKLLKKTFVNKNQNLWNLHFQEDQIDKDLKKMLTQLKNIRHHQYSSYIIKEEGDKEAEGQGETLEECQGERQKDKQNQKQQQQEDFLTFKNFDKQITQINCKINILQQILAANYTESELLKKYYHAKRNKRKSNILQNMNDGILKQKIKDLHKSSQAIKNIPTVLANSSNLSNPSISYSTLNKTQYSKPLKIHYNTLPLKPKSWVKNNQPMGRSSYQCQFLQYGSLPTYVHKNPDSYSQNNLSILKSSTYQKDFKEMKASLIDPDSLDCKEDKIKYKFDKLRLSKGNFIFKKTNEWKQNQSKINNPLYTMRYNQEVKQVEEQTEQRKQKNSSTCRNKKNKFTNLNIHLYKTLTTGNRMPRTQNQANYKETKTPPQPSVIKDKNLNQLKNRFKFECRA